MLRLYGSVGPLFAANVPPGDVPTELSAGQSLSPPGYLEVAGGTLQTAAGVGYPYQLHWGMSGRSPVAHEILADRDLRFHANQLLGRPAPGWLPPPLSPLDQVEDELRGVTLRANGLALFLRCATAWERAGCQDLLRVHPAPVLAAAVTRLISWRSGIRASTADIAARYLAPLDEVRAAEKPLQRVLALSATVCW